MQSLNAIARNSAQNIAKQISGANKIEQKHPAQTNTIPTQEIDTKNSNINSQQDIINQKEQENLNLRKALTEKEQELQRLLDEVKNKQIIATPISQLQLGQLPVNNNLQFAYDIQNEEQIQYILNVAAYIRQLEAKLFEWQFNANENNQLANRNPNLALETYISTLKIEDITDEDKKENQSDKTNNYPEGLAIEINPRPDLNNNDAFNTENQMIEDKENDKQESINEFTLHSATRANNLEAVKKLLENKNLDVNRKDEKGQTPLHIAMEKNLIDIAKTLTLAGAKPFEPDNQGVSPCEIAQAKGNTQIIIDILDSHLASHNKDNEIFTQDSNANNNHANVSWKKSSSHSNAASINFSKTFGTATTNDSSDNSAQENASDELANSFVKLGNSSM